MAKKITEDGEVIDTVTYEPIAMAPPFFKTPHNHDRDAESIATGLSCKDPTRTQQHHMQEVDIKNILAKFIQGGELPITGTPRYMHVDDEFDLQRQMVTAHEVEQAWNKLPVSVRNMLRDPKTFADYVDHCMETGDIEPLRELGLAPAKEPPQAPPGAPGAANAAPPVPPAPQGGSPAPTVAPGANPAP